MWLVDDNKKIDTFSWSPKGVTIKSGQRAAWDAAMSAYPYAPDGYNRYFDVSVEGVNVMLSTKIERYDIPNRTVWLKGEKKSFDVIINAISPDELFGRCHGDLKYIGRDFHKIVFPTEHVFPNMLLPLLRQRQEFTRLVEYKSSPPPIADQSGRHGNPMMAGIIPRRSRPIRNWREIRQRCWNTYFDRANGSYRWAHFDDCISRR
jgi:hypothetical protein